MAGPKPRNRDGWEDCQGPGAFHVEILGSNQGLSWRACGARPSAGWQAWVRGLGGKPGDNADGGFLGGAHSVRPPGKATRMPMNCICTPRRGERPVAYRGHVSVKPGPSLRACGARPSAGWTIQAGMA